jgi:hypothetical protein
MRKFLIFLSIVAIIGIVIFVSNLAKNTSKSSVISTSLSAANNVIKLLPIKEDTKKEIEVIDRLVEEITKKDNRERKFLILLQNNMELRPGGGFLGQYAVVKIKNGEVIDNYFEDANLLDQRINAKVPTPYPFERMMSLKRWKFRDSNFSPDYPTNVEKAKYFYRLAGRSSDFDGVIAVNAFTFNRVFNLTGPITVPGYGVTLNSENATLELEEIVEKKYILDENLDTQNRKAIMKTLTNIIIEKIVKIENIAKISKFVLEELRNKDVMLNFKDENLQELVKGVHWGGSVARDWPGDYLMLVDANMGALKSNYYIKRDIEYNVDLTGEKPMAELRIFYRHEATYGDWRTMDYHSYLRIYTPEGSNLLEREMVSYPLTVDEFGKTYFGFIMHVLINRNTDVRIKYELPESVREGDYKLLMQKQSGIGEIPVKINVKTNDGDFSHEEVLKKDLKFELK